MQLQLQHSYRRRQKSYRIVVTSHAPLTDIICLQLFCWYFLNFLF